MRFLLNVSIVSLWLLVLNTQVEAQTGESLKGRPLSVAESTGYLRTASSQQVFEYMESLGNLSSRATLTSIGTSLEGRSIHAMVLAKEGANPLPLDNSDSRITILILGGIHSGECDSKEAILMLARNLLFEPEKLERYLEHCVLVFVPNFNTDGNERVGVMHRPGQSGPDGGMGIRENASGADLNRDFVKLDTFEVRSLVRAIDVWDVDVLLDAHTTNGSLHQYDLTYDIPHNPAANPSMVKWLRTEFLPEVSTELSQAGLPTFYYGNFSADHSRWESFGHEPRYSTEYMGLRGKMGILVESYSYASYQRRIEATMLFIDTCLKQLTQQAAMVRNLIRDNPVTPHRVPIQARIIGDEKKYSVNAYSWKENVPPPAGSPQSPDPQPSEEARKSQDRGNQYPTPRDRNRLDEMVKRSFEVELWNVGQAEKLVVAPKFYFIPFENSWAASRLRMHGVELVELGVPSEDSSSVSATCYRVQSIKDLPEFQGRRPRKLDVVEEQTTWKPTAGWVVSTTQPLGVLAAYLLEPHADESLAFWNFFEPDIKVDQLYPVMKLDSLPPNLVKHSLPRLALREMTTKDMAKEQLSLERLLHPSMRTSLSSAPVAFPRWLPDRPEYLTQIDNRWYSVDCETGSRKPFDKMAKLADALSKLEAFNEAQSASTFRGSPQVFDADFSNALIEHQEELFLYRSQEDKAYQLTKDRKSKKIPSLSPSGNHVAYIHDHNLWTVDCKTLEIKQLTHDGGEEILNGYLDWVYQEEVYGRGKFKSYWWSPNGNRIAFLRLDESPVPTFVIDNSLPFAQSLEKMRYPKSGQPNPRVTLHVVSLNDGSVQEVPLDGYPPDDRLVVRVGWSTAQPDHVVYQVQNRIQSSLDVWVYDAQTKKSSKIVEEKSQAWVDVIDEPRWLPDGSFLWLSDSEKGRRHLYRIDSLGKRTALTQGAWDVKEVLWVANDGRKVVISAHRSHPANTDLLSIDLVNQSITPLGTESGTHNASIHPTGKYMFDAWSDIEHPSQLWLCDSKAVRIRFVGNYKSDRFETLETIPPELFSITARDGLAMQAMFYKPTDFKERIHRGKLPVLIHVYGGPQARTVENVWTHRSDLWHRFMTEQGVPVLLCDNRSALGRGNADTWKIYRDLGAVELRDLEDAVRWLKTQDWVDPDRIGLWGWSYGGYFTAYAMTHSKLFRAGIAGAPVTDWHNYDSIYTERYMSTPQLNPDGYRSSSVVTAAADLQGRLMIIHGEIDDNVHLANSMQLVHALQRAGKQFEFMVYPNNRHGITDPEQTQHQFRMMTDFFLRELRR